MTFQEMADLVYACTYKPGWQIHLLDPTSRPYLQLSVDGIDSVTKEPTSWRSGKRYLSPHMCRQEVVGAVFALIKDAEEHEMREWFRYKGVSIFNPHLDPEALYRLAGRMSNYSMRENPMTMKEST